MVAQPLATAWDRRGSATGHEERFPPLRLGAGYAFRKETIAGTSRNGRDAPIQAIRRGSEIGQVDPQQAFALTYRSDSPR